MGMPSHPQGGHDDTNALNRQLFGELILPCACLRRGLNHAVIGAVWAVWGRSHRRFRLAPLTAPLSQATPHRRHIPPFTLNRR